MINNDEKIKQYLIRLGLDRYEAKIYLTLVESGILTPLELSRITKIDRSKIYRRLEAMKKAGFVEEVIDEHKKMARAADIEKIEHVLQEKNEKMKTLVSEFDDVKLLLTGIMGQNDPSTKVLFYRGKEGLRQMIWNNLRAKQEVVGFTYRRVSEYVGITFVERWRDEFIARNLSFRHIYSDHYLKSIKDLEDKAESYPDDRFQARYIPQNILDVNHQVDIYNDTVTYYNWHEGEVFGVEIYNSKIATMQKQRFEIVWRRTRHKS